MVRMIAEQLIASGLNIWFAEYAILVSDRYRFDYFINQGIKYSRYGMLFTNNMYINSRYCREELQQLLSQGEVIEIKYPDEPLVHHLYPELERSPSMEYHGDPNEISHYFQSVTGLSMDLGRIETVSRGAHEHFFYDSLEYSLDLTGWEITSRGEWYKLKAFGNRGGPTFQRVFGPHRIQGNLLVGRAPRAARRVSSDDREAYEFVLNAANTFYKWTTSEKCVGVHLLFLMDMSHAAFTTWVPSSAWWSRRYSIVLPAPNTGDNLEFAFLFSFSGGSFR